MTENERATGKTVRAEREDWIKVQGEFPNDTIVFYNPGKRVFQKISARVNNNGDLTEGEVEHANRKFEEVKRDFEVGSSLSRELPEYFPRYLTMRVGDCSFVKRFYRSQDRLGRYYSEDESDDSGDESEDDEAQTKPSDIEECIVIETEQVAGIPLFRWLLDRPSSFSVSSFICIMKTIFGIHQKLKHRFTHYDLHPANIYVSFLTTGSGYFIFRPDCQIHLLDFGASFYQSPTGQVFGQNEPDFGRIPKYFWMYDAVCILYKCLYVLDRQKAFDMIKFTVKDLFPIVWSQLGHSAAHMPSSPYLIKKHLIPELETIATPESRLLLDILHLQDSLKWPSSTGLHEKMMSNWLISALGFLDFDPADFTWQLGLLKPLPKYLNRPFEPFYQFILRSST